MQRVLHLALVLGLALSLSGAGGLLTDDCALDCATESQSDPCSDESAPCSSCFACPCATRAPAVPLATVTAPPLAVAERFGEWLAVSPTAPPAGRPFQPPRA